MRNERAILCLHAKTEKDISSTKMRSIGKFHIVGVVAFGEKSLIWFPMFIEVL